MQETREIIDLDQLDHSRFRSWPFSHDFCITCGVCAGSCPASGIDGVDPRMLVRMVSLGLEDELVEARLQARANKDWANADRIRDELIDAGIVIEDGSDGTRWRRA